MCVLMENRLMVLQREREDGKWQGLAEARSPHKQGRLGEARKSEDQNIRGGERVRAEINTTQQKQDSPRSRVDETQARILEDLHT